MHWLSQQLDQIGQALLPTTDGGAPPARRAAYAQAQALVQQITGLDGVEAAIAAHDGLLVAGSGTERAQQAMAALSPWAWLPPSGSLKALNLGPLQQVLLSGPEHKLALLRSGALTLGVLAPVDLHLAERLAHGPTESV